MSGRGGKRAAAAREEEESGADDSYAQQPPAKKFAKPDNSSSDSSDGIVVCEIGRNRRVTVRNWRGKINVDIREFYPKDGNFLPGKKGITLSLEQWNMLRDHVEEIDKALDIVVDGLCITYWFDASQGYVDVIQCFGASQQMSVGNTGYDFKMKGLRENREMMDDMLEDTYHPPDENKGF
ncbi:unnamed protein product [Dovyalis caffra]|uniref:Transcriptional coactivator p15 (PC4) C-terminal domain-containing protein n=1 Tax=Dovyalis caffra TaxID=77055 RepID=A0AAV1SR95_9ROSI|nr:unnamed protein product [Dovyalis caffra]